MGFLVSLARTLALALHSSKEPTGFTPLSKVRALVVFVDADEPGVDSVVRAVSAYFASKSVRVSVFAVSSQKDRPAIDGAELLTRRKVNWFGRPRRGRRYAPVAVGEQLFINLVGRENFTAEYCAVASKAVFKIARRESRRCKYDIIVSSEGFGQNEVFAQMCGLLDTVK